MDMKCSACGAPMQEGDAHCGKCKASMTCTEEKCSCVCGNETLVSETKCDACLGETPSV